jgi:hypothetical protein
LQYKLYDKHGGKLYLCTYVLPDCKAGIPENLMYLKYEFPGGMESNSDRWLGWKMDFLDCNGDLFTQQFYAPLHLQFFETHIYFLNAPSVGQAFDFQSEGVYPKTLPGMKEISPEGPYEIKEFIQPGFRPSALANPQKKCGSVDFNFSNPNVDEILVSWSECKQCSELKLRHRVKGESLWNEQVYLPKQKKGAKVKAEIQEKSQVLSALLVDTIYEFQMGSKCLFSDKINFSPIKEFRTLKSQCPVPQNLRILRAFADSLVLEWDGGTTTKFSFAYKPSDSEEYEFVELDDPWVEFWDLEMQSAYSFKVAGIDKYGIGEYSDPLVIFTSYNPAPNVVKVKDIAINSESAEIEWSVDYNVSNKERIKNNTQFKCELYDLSGIAPVMVKDVTTNDLKLELKDLHYFTKYKLQITSILDKKYINPNPTEYRFQTAAIEKNVEIVCQNIFRDSLTWTLYAVKKGGKSQYIKTISKLSNDQKNLNLKFDNEYLYYTLYTEYKNKRFDNASTDIFWDKDVITNKDYSLAHSKQFNLSERIEPFKVYVDVPEDLNRTFTFSTRSVNKIGRKVDYLLTMGSVLAQYQDDKTMQFIQPLASLSIGIKRIQVRGQILPILSPVQMGESAQFPDGLTEVSGSFAIKHGEKKINHLADKRLNLFRGMVFSSGKKISPEYETSWFLTGGYLDLKNSQKYNLYQVLYETRDFELRSQNIKSFEFGTSLQFSSKYTLNYFQKRAKKGDLSGVPIRRFASFNLRFSYLLPIAGQLEVADLTTEQITTRELAREEMTSGFKANIEHSYNVRKTSIVVTRGIAYTYYPTFNVGQSMQGTISLYFGLGLTNIPRRDESSKK